MAKLSLHRQAGYPSHWDSPQVANRQATPAARAPSHAAVSSQAGRQVTQATGASPQVALNSQAGSQATPRAVGWQAFPADSTLSQAESLVSQAGNPPASPADRTLPQAESEISQAGNPLYSPADSTLSQAGSNVSQADNPQVAPAVQCLARLMALHASQNNNSQAGGSQAGNTPMADSAISQLGSKASQLGSSQADSSQVISSTSPQEARSSLLPNRQNSPQGSSSLEEPNPKWVFNLSSKPLTKTQRSVLPKGPNFAVSPKHPPNLEYITAIEAACTKLSQQDAEELRADVNQVLRGSHPPNLTLLKHKA